MRNYTVWPLLLVASSSQAQLTLTDRVLWPEEGYFLAYPVEDEDDEFKVSASLGYSYDDNLYRLSDDEDPQTLLGESGRSDTIRRAGASAKWDIPVDRQLFKLNARVDNYDFNRFTFLDYTGYAVGANWGYRAGPQLSGDLSYQRSRSLTSFNEVQERVRDLITSDYGFVSGRYQIYPRLRVRGQFAGSRYEHSASSRDDLDQHTTSETIGVDYVSLAENTLGLQLKLEQGKYPNRQVVAGSTVDNEYDEYEISAVAGWQFALKTRFDGRIGYTDRSHAQVPQRDFSGVTLRGVLGYAPSAKTLLDLAVYREISSVSDLIASYVLTEGVSFGAAWAPTVKIHLQAKLLYENREYVGDPGFVLGVNQQRDDQVYGARLTAGYKPLRILDLWVAYEHGRRSSSIGTSEYDFDLVTANAGISF